MPCLAARGVTHRTLVGFVAFASKQETSGPPQPHLVAGQSLTFPPYPRASRDVLCMNDFSPRTLEFESAQLLLRCCLRYNAFVGYLCPSLGVTSVPYHVMWPARLFLRHICSKVWDFCAPYLFGRFSDAEFSSSHEKLDTSGFKIYNSLRIVVFGCYRPDIPASPKHPPYPLRIMLPGLVIPQGQGRPLAFCSVGSLERPDAMYFDRHSRSAPSPPPFFLIFWPTSGTHFSRGPFIFVCPYCPQMRTSLAAPQRYAAPRYRRAHPGPRENENHDFFFWEALVDHVAS